MYNTTGLPQIPLISADNQSLLRLFAQSAGNIIRRFIADMILERCVIIKVSVIHPAAFLDKQFRTAAIIIAGNGFPVALRHTHS